MFLIVSHVDSKHLSTHAFYYRFSIRREISGIITKSNWSSKSDHDDTSETEIHTRVSESVSALGI